MQVKLQQLSTTEDVSETLHRPYNLWKWSRKYFKVFFLIFKKLKTHNQPCPNQVSAEVVKADIGIS